jgi:Glycosyl hydrolase family 1
MSFRRGAALPVSTTLGFAESSDLGPTAGNGFYKRWPDDLALLADLGVADLRLTFDWARLQPKPGEFAGDWVERYENLFAAADAIGISVWGAMYDSGVPKWFANEGGIDDDEAITRWWPRWIERVADTFGEHVDGWIPFAVLPESLPDQVWIDTWRVLGAGDPPVVASLAAADGYSFAGRRNGEFDVLGVALPTHLSDDLAVTDDDLRLAAEHWEQALNDAAAAAPDEPIMISSFTPTHTDPDVSGQMMERLVGAIEAAVADGIEVTTCLVEPAIAGPDSSSALVASDRTATPAADAFLIAPGD